jgi:hypothetical protein
VGGLAAEAVLGPTWAGAGIVIQLMGLRMGLEWLVGLNSTALAARGRPDLNVKLLVIAAVIAVPVYVGCAPLGLVAFCWARLASAQVINAIAYGLTRPVLGLPAGFLWTRVRAPAAAALVMAGGVWAMQRAGVTVGLPGLALAVAAGAALYTAVLAVLDRPTLAWGVATARRLWARDGAAVAGA